MKKKVLISALSVLMIIMFAGCGNSNSVVGTWVVKEYDIKGKSVSTSEIADYYGDMIAQYNDTTLILTDTGNLSITVPDFSTGGMKESKASYTVQDDHIEVLNPNDPTDFELIEYDGKTIRLEMDTFTVVLEKK